MIRNLLSKPKHHSSTTSISFCIVTLINSWKDAGENMMQQSFVHIWTGRCALIIGTSQERRLTVDGDLDLPLVWWSYSIVGDAFIVLRLLPFDLCDIQELSFTHQPIWQQTICFKRFTAFSWMKRSSWIHINDSTWYLVGEWGFVMGHGIWFMNLISVFDIVSSRWNTEVKTWQVLWHVIVH